MKLTFLGANHEVTGSCTLLEAAGQRYLIDCGMEQGKDVYENQPIPVAPGEIDGVLATHAHIDHTGLLPLLVRNGFRGRIYATRPTAELCSIMLRDSAHIQEFEAEWKNRKGQRSGAEPVEPMYTIQDAEAAIALFRGYDYNKEIELAPGIVIRFVDVGHLLGSSSIEIWVTENGATTKLVFSGDIGNLDQPIIKDPTYLKDADYVFMESTYGDRSHGPRPDYVAELAKILQRTFDRGGNVVIPSFAVGRTQELLYFIREIKEKNLITGHGCFPVYIDSPLAIEATRIFKDTDSSCFDEETNALLAKGIDPIQFPGLKVSVTSDESRAINTDPVPKVIISASGMCEAGRIRHHLKHNLWRKECTILFVGYQAVNTLGRSLLEGADLFGSQEAAQERIDAFRNSLLQDGETYDEYVNLSPQPQTSLTIIDQKTGQIKALVGGRGQKTTNRGLNRAYKGSTRNAGSTFKILAVYAPALDSADLTLATTEVDEEYYYQHDLEHHQVHNWWGDYYKGTVTYRQAIEQSMNIIAVKTLNKIGINLGFEYCEKFGLSTLTEDDAVESLALGGISHGVYNYELLSRLFP